MPTNHNIQVPFIETTTTRPLMQYASHSSKHVPWTRTLLIFQPAARAWSNSGPTHATRLTTQGGREARCLWLAAKPLAATAVVSSQESGCMSTAPSLEHRLARACNNPESWVTQLRLHGAQDK